MWVWEIGESRGLELKVLDGVRAGLREMGGEQGWIWEGCGECWETGV